MLMSTRLALVTVLAACGSAPPPPHMATAEPPKLTIPPGVIEPGVVLIGDLHGTREIPAFVGDLVATVVRQRPVVLGLEIPPGETPSFDGFLASDGGPAARERLLADPWWRYEFQDGRRSVAMAELIEAMRARKAAGANITVDRIDTLPKGPERDRGMADRVIELRKAHPDAVIIVYAGDLHTMRKGGPRRPGYQWMAMHLAAGGVAFVSLAPRYEDGSAWVCLGATPADCGASLVGGKPGPRGITLAASPDGNYDGGFGLGPVTASPPAAFPELAKDFDRKLAALRDGPEGVRLRARRAAAAQDYRACVTAFEALAAPTGGDAYDHACCLAQLGSKDAAFERLQFAIDHGFTDLAHASTDTDLASLHDDPRWPLKPR
jgi:hypothetical protein